MHAVSISICKGEYHQFYCRLCIKGTCCAKKFTSSKAPLEKPQRQKNWWKTGVQNVFGKYLLFTNTVSSGVLMAVGDLIQQQIEYTRSGKHKDSFDWRRNIHMGIVGVLQGSLTHFFYQFLDKFFPGIKLTTIAKKIFFDQTIASPFCIVLFFVGMNYLNGEDFKASKDELKEKFLTVYAADCIIWIPVQFINFYYLSSHYRVIYINLITMCYNIFLSYMKHAHGVR